MEDNLWRGTEPNVLETQVFESMALHKFKALCPKEKIPKKLVDYVHLSTMATFYTLHFANYSLGKKQVTQLIPNSHIKENSVVICISITPIDTIKSLGKLHITY